MKPKLVEACLACIALAARLFINEYDTGFQDSLGQSFPKGKLPDLQKIKALEDFDYAARNFLNDTAYTWIRHGVGSEHTYRNNVEVWPKVGFRPRMLTGTSKVNETMTTTILGYNFSAPLFISPAAAPGAVGGFVPRDRELGFLDVAFNENILYIPAMYAEMSLEEMTEARQGRDQAIFQQFYAENNDTLDRQFLEAAEAAGAKAIVWTIDAPADGTRIRSERYSIPASTKLKTLSWDSYNKFKNMTRLPIIPKGILTVADAKKCVELGAPAIIISNHGGRHLDGAPSALEVALSIHDQAPEIFSQTEVLADGGVRYGTDFLKLLALGVKAVGLGRTFMYANIYGQPGVEHAIQLLKKEIFLDAVNLGAVEMSQLDEELVNFSNLRQYL